MAAVVAIISALPGSSGAAATRTAYRQTRVITIPVKGGPLLGDIIVGDQSSGRVFFSDDANLTLDVIDGRHDRLVHQVKGFHGGGPNGVLDDGQGRVWVADGNGTVWVLQAAPPYRRLALIRVGPSADEIGFDATDGVIVVTSPDPRGKGRFAPFVTLIDAKPGDGYRTLGRIQVPAPAGTLEQPQWDAAIGDFVESVRHTPTMPGGAVAVLDPVHLAVARMIKLTGCHASGLAVAPGGDALVGCGLSGPQLLDPATATVLQRYSHRSACCADEVGYDGLAGRFVVAEGGSDGAPPAPQLRPPAVLVIDAATHRLVSTVHLGNNAGPFHQATMLGRAGTLFVPEGDGIHVFRATGG